MYHLNKPRTFQVGLSPESQTLQEKNTAALNKIRNKSELELLLLKPREMSRKSHQPSTSTEPDRTWLEPGKPNPNVILMGRVITSAASSRISGKGQEKKKSIPGLLPLKLKNSESNKSVHNITITPLCPTLAMAVEGTENSKLGTDSTVNSNNKQTTVSSENKNIKVHGSDTMHEKMQNEIVNTDKTKPNDGPTETSKLLNWIKPMEAASSNLKEMYVSFNQEMKNVNQLIIALEKHSDTAKTTTPEESTAVSSSHVVLSPQCLGKQKDEDQNAKKHEESDEKHENKAAEHENDEKYKNKDDEDENIDIGNENNFEEHYTYVEDVDEEHESIDGENENDGKKCENNVKDHENNDEDHENNVEEHENADEECEIIHENNDEEHENTDEECENTDEENENNDEEYENNVEDHENNDEGQENDCDVNMTPTICVEYVQENPKLPKLKLSWKPKNTPGSRYPDIIKSENQIKIKTSFYKSFLEKLEDTHATLEYVKESIRDKCLSVKNILKSIRNTRTLIEKCSVRKMSTKGQTGKVSQKSRKKNLKHLKSDNNKWTLKYKEPNENTVELMPNSQIYVNEKHLNKCKQRARNWSDSCRLLLPLIFTKPALKRCSMSGKPQDGMGRRPGLNQSGIDTLCSFVMFYWEVRPIKNKNRNNFVNPMFHLRKTISRIVNRMNSDK